MSVLALTLALAVPAMGLAAEGYGAAAVREGQTYTVEQMLIYALQDEYLARAEYKAIMEKFGEEYRLLIASHGVEVFEAGKIVETDPLDGIHLDAVNTKKLGEALAPLVRQMRED